MDLATLIKPVLTAGELRVIGSTTFEEFKHIEKDRALARRLQKVAVEEPSLEETVRILEGLQQRVRGSPPREVHRRRPRGRGAASPRRHLRDCRLPDSAIDVLDEAGAMPAERLHARATRDAGGAGPTGPRKARNRARERRTTAGDLATPSSPWSTPPTSSASSRGWRASRTGRRRRSDKQRLRTLEESLGRVVVRAGGGGQLVAPAIKRSRAGLGQPDRPAGCFLFTGPTGVGKTELAKQLAMHLGNEFIRYDMSEDMEKHTVARLIGAPPGYVGFEQGGLLVDVIR